MDVAHIGFRKGHARAVGGFQHSLAGRLVLSVLVSRLQMLVDQAHGLLRHRPGFLRGGASDIGLHRMGQGVHAGGGCDLGRQAHRLMIVQHRVKRNQAEIIDGVFIMLLAIRDDGRQGRLAARSRRGGNRDQKWEPLMYLQKALHLADTLPGLRDPRARRLGAVHGGAAAKGDNSLGSIFQIKLPRLFHVPDRRIGHRPVVDAAVDAALLQGLLQEIRKPHGTDPWVRNQHHGVHLPFPADTWNLFYRMQKLRLPVGQEGQSRPEDLLKDSAVSFS